MPTPTAQYAARVEAVMRLAPVIPVLVIEDVAHAVPIAEALVAGGLPALEVTLRTPCALEVITAMKSVPGAVVGAGTVLNPTDLAKAIDAGAEFLVSPGLTAPLGDAALKADVPLLPGTANATDVMLAMDMGFERLKFFPAMAAGGPPALKAISAPLAGARFCPTGGVTPANAPEWLALDCVVCVGGSWMVPKGTPDVAAIEAAAREAATLGA
ncbi:bifunctional 4-hydroxy-2-oxoglutarate aldolase/2-dehydro-3-deoxy-phosphogluconate aldolase [Novosphingobium sp. 1949]|uniref:2-dehydro-3-deoxy-phosphogluconate aldolase n=1 Tax=Novosphingobium organovorum TaxID=2930092 RepID=A0ABT0BEC2_9SPHN|nr:bifunctional 4-hydroxy-2-oxoglutarate aldolase/2-dehydro-3-deoxy-phosphogluconate aldolase [Novosphingobium organovorum]MCJ2183354.1 bifunctional 4-hydroxy-2-oxoglutarate aldolase/2-dehydro-3-deoxy-phosphogluconate aldolase [Novosphingobium organovorum]